MGVEDHALADARDLRHAHRDRYSKVVFHRHHSLACGCFPRHLHQHYTVPVSQLAAHGELLGSRTFAHACPHTGQMDCGRHLQQRLLRRLGHTSHGQPPVHLPPIAARPGSCWDLRRPARALDELSRLHTRGMESTSTPALLAKNLTSSATYPAHTDEVFVFVYGSTVERPACGGLWRLTRLGTFAARCMHTT